MAIPSDKVSLSVVRDFRVPGAPSGTLAVLTENYYAWWSHLDPEMLHVQNPRDISIAWADLALGARWGNAACEPLRPDGTLRAVENWGGKRQLQDSFILGFTQGKGTFRVGFYPERIELMAESAAPASLVESVFWGRNSNGTGSRFGGSSIFSGGPESHGVGMHPSHRSLQIRPDWFTPPPFVFACELA